MVGWRVRGSQVNILLFAHLYTVQNGGFPKLSKIHVNPKAKINHNLLENEHLTPLSSSKKKRNIASLLDAYL